MAKISMLSVDKIILVLLLQTSCGNCFLIKTIFDFLDSLFHCTDHCGGHGKPPVKPPVWPIKPPVNPLPWPCNNKPCVEGPSNWPDYIPPQRPCQPSGGYPPGRPCNIRPPQTEGPSNWPDYVPPQRPCNNKPPVGIPCYYYPLKKDSQKWQTRSQPPTEEELVLIWPGTKWCGPGNNATDYDDLGEFVQTDTCCRQHDHCEDGIPPGESVHGLTNNGSYSRVDCKCDAEFHRCLHKAEEPLAETIGKLYFDVLETKCFRQDYPIVKCNKYASTETRKTDIQQCVEYELDDNKNQTYQWFDVPPY